jgi:hypothetical protein
MRQQEEPIMAMRARGLASPFLISCLVLGLGACNSHQWSMARDNTLGAFGFARKPAVARDVPAPAAPTPVAVPAAEDEPVPAAAPRTPVETERVAPPPGAGRRS